MLDVVNNFNATALVIMLFKIVVISLITTILIMIPYCIYKKQKAEKIHHPIFLGIFIFYLIALLIVTIYRFGSTLKYPSVNVIPLKQIIDNFKAAYAYNTHLAIRSFTYNVLGNVIWFIPMGFLLPIIGKTFDFKMTLGIGFVASLWIELIQYVLVVGICDVDDMIFNTLGCLIGYCCYKVAKYIKEVIYEYKRTS